MSHVVADPRRLKLSFYEVVERLFGREKARALRTRLEKSRGPEL
jgi:hypothetical protein